MYSVSLSAGELSDLLLLVWSLEIERRNISSRRHLFLAQDDVVETPGNFLKERVIRVQSVSILIDVGNNDRIADP